MKFLKKKADSDILEKALSYDKNSDRLEIKSLLIAEQYGFCAYSEQFIRQADEVDIEHFDGRYKKTENDGYYNWYAVLSWFNSHKPKK